MRKRPRPILPLVPVACAAAEGSVGGEGVERLLADVEPILARNDATALGRLLCARYQRQDLRALLNCDVADARKVAALALGMIGDIECVPALVKRLGDGDAMVSQMAEHALWSIWCRAGTAEGNARLVLGIQALDDRRAREAVEEFGGAIAACPTFSEAYNQRAIAHFLLDEPRSSLADCRRAVERMPAHFGAWAGMGHCHAQMGEVADALKCYRRALAINPRMSSIAEMVGALNRCDASRLWRAERSEGGEGT